MNWRTDNSRLAAAPARRFLLGPPQDSDDLLQLFSLVLEKADVGFRAGKRFGVPFAAVLKLANRNRPSSSDLAQFCGPAKSGAAVPSDAGSNKDWRTLFPNCVLPAEGSVKPATTGLTKIDLPGAGLEGRVAPAMFPDLLNFALASAERFNLQGPQVCRVLAAVGQTLEARDGRYRQQNRSLADRHRGGATRRLAPAAGGGEAFPIAVKLEPDPEPEAISHLEPSSNRSHILVSRQPPWQIDFLRHEEQAACLSLDGISLWHASYIGPGSAEKSENQDSTFAMTTVGMSSPPCLVFALADGVTTSLGSRLAATSIVRRFCELVLRQMRKGERLTGSDLIESARQTQISIDELARALLQETNPYLFESMLGNHLTPKVATRVLENTLHPKVAAMPPALNATLIGGVAQAWGDSGGFQIELLRIGDGVVEHLDAHGNLTRVLDTDPAVTAISESLGPGPQSSALFAQGSNSITTRTVTLSRGESLLVSSDGLTRGHEQPVSRKLSELLGQEFWKRARPEEADFALQVLHRACAAADDRFRQDATQELFADNVSVIMVRAGD